MLKQINKYLSFLIALLLFGYLVLRAIYVPIVHDEAATFFHYIHKGSFLPWLAHWDANNHVINSGLSSFFFGLFGKSLLVIRLANLLAFIPFAWFSWKLSCRLNDRLLRYLCFTALVSARFVLEFFALSRGYGLSMAFLLGAVWQLSIYFENNTPRHLIIGLGLMSAAVWANLSLINSFSLIFALVVVDGLINGKWRNLSQNQYIGIVFSGLIPYVLALLFAFDLKERGALYYGALDGIIPVTVDSLLKFQFVAANSFTRVLLITLFFSIIAVVLWGWLRKKPKTVNLHLLLVVLLLGNFIGALLLARLLGVNYPEDRAAIYFIPLLILAFCFALETLSAKQYKVKYLGLLLLFFPINTLLTANVRYSNLWVDQTLAPAFYQKLKQVSPKPTVACYHLQQMTWSHYNLNENQSMVAPQIGGYPSKIADWQIIHSVDYPKVSRDYEVVETDQDLKLLLLKRKFPLIQTKVIDHTPANSASNCTDEFYGFYEQIDSVFSEQIVIDLRFKLTSPEEPFSAQVVISVDDSTGSNVIYDFIPVDWIKSKWAGEEFSIHRCLGGIPKNPKRVVIYLWNIDKKQFTVRDARLEIYALTENTSFTNSK